jgi:hypothetical protein
MVDLTIRHADLIPYALTVLAFAVWGMLLFQAELRRRWRAKRMRAWLRAHV